MKVVTFTAETLLAELDELELAGRTAECRELAEASLPQIDASHPTLLAMLHLKIGRMAWIDPQDTKGGDYEYAISHLNRARTLLDTTELAGNPEIPFVKALVDLNLGGVLSYRVKGDPKKNIEDSIQAHSRALKYLNKTTHPVHFAAAHHNIGRSYYLRQKEGREKNLEESIKHLKKAAQARDRKNMPAPWSNTQMNLGIAYTYRIRGKSANNIESALEHFEYAVSGFGEAGSAKEAASELVEIIRCLSQLARRCPDRLTGRLGALAESIGRVVNDLEGPLARLRAHHGLADMYYELRHQDPITSLVKAVRHYESAIACANREDNEVEWARLSYNLGNACWQLLDEDFNQGPRKAIEFLEEAESVLTKNEYPLEWARIQASKGAAYRADKSGDHAETFRRAVTAFDGAAEVFTKEEKWEELASLNVDLGNAYVDSNVGDLGENIEQAIDLFEQALKTIEDAPNENPGYRTRLWGRANNALGIAYAKREIGDPSQNFTKGAHHLNNALSVFSRRTAPRYWASAHMNFCSLSMRLPNRELRKRLNEILEHFGSALSVFTQDKYPYEWATANYNLCTITRAADRPSDADSIAKAVDLLTASLSVFKRDSAPRDWAMVHRELMLWHSMDPSTDLNKTLHRVSNSARKALQVYRKDRYIFDWALVHAALGEILCDYSGTPFKRWKNAALRHFSRAESVLTPDLHPRTYVAIQAMKGRLHLNEGAHQDAEEAFAAAITAAAIHLGESYSHAGRDHLIRSSARLYSDSAYCRLMLGDYTGAVTRLEQGKARHLSEVLVRHAADLRELAPNEKEAITIARSEIERLEAKAYQHTASGEDQQSLGLLERLGAARKRFREILEQIRTEHPDFMPEELVVSQGWWRIGKLA